MIRPDDEDRRRWMNNVHPPNWVNPTPTGRYNLVVLGAGTAGLVTAAIASGLGAKVALVEKSLMGGDCLNVGCVPSKGVIRASRAWSALRHADRFGVQVPSNLKHDFPAVMARMRNLRARIGENDSVHRFKGLGVDLFLGEGGFTGSDTLSVGGQTLRFAKAAICTGARASALQVPGTEEVGYLTNETLFDLTDLPPRLALIGGGPIGCEMGQAFARFGSQVTLFSHGARILPREDIDAAEIVSRSMARDGVRFIFDTQIVRLSSRGKEKIVHYKTGEVEQALAVDEILVAVGRQPNVEGLGLKAVGIAYDPKRGVTVNDRLQTTAPNIFAAGDVCSSFQFTHAAEAMAQIVIQNALFPHPFGLGYARCDLLVIPWCTYTDPEVAHVGMYKAEAEAKGIEVETFTCKLDEVDRALLDGEEEGLAQVVVKRGTDRILGATVVASHAGEMIGELTLAMKGKLGLATVAGTIHPYPTQAEVIKKVAYAWRKSTFTAGKKAWLARWFSWRR